MSDPDYNYIRVRADTVTDPLIRRLTDPPFGTETSERNLMAEAARALLDAWAERDAARADADAAIALVVERAVGIMRAVAIMQASAAIWRDDTMNPYFGENVADSLEDDIAAIRALASESGLAAVQKLRAERDGLRAAIEQLQGPLTVAALVARAEAAEAELAASRAREAVLREILVDAGALRDAADRVSEWFCTEARHLEGPRIQAMRANMEAYDRHMRPHPTSTPAALAQAPDGEGG